MRYFAALFAFLILTGLTSTARALPGDVVAPSAYTIGRDGVCFRGHKEEYVLVYYLDNYRLYTLERQAGGEWLRKRIIGPGAEYIKNNYDDSILRMRDRVNFVIGRFGKVYRITHDNGKFMEKETFVANPCDTAAPPVKVPPVKKPPAKPVSKLGLHLGTIDLGQTPGVFGQESIPHTDDFRAVTGVDPLLWEAFSNKKTGWGNIEAPAWQFGPLQTWTAANPGKGIIYSFAPIPESEGMGVVPLTKCANGDYNAHYRNFADFLEARGMNAMIMRVGWEWQGNYYPWGVSNNVDNAHLFAACYRNVVRTIREAYPTNKFLFDWNPTYGVKSEVLPAAWPGDEYVDTIGIDIYDQNYTGCGTAEPCRWNVMSQNVERIKAFAVSHNKPLSIPEFGVWHGAVGGGDNGYFVQKVCEFAKNPANKVAYFTYFNANAASDHRLSANPNAAAAYRTYCR